MKPLITRKGLNAAAKAIRPRPTRCDDCNMRRQCSRVLGLKGLEYLCRECREARSM